MKKRIMIVDDSTSMRQVAGATLSLAGYDIVEACDGQDALSKLTGKFHLIISDINMPRMDGISFLKAVKGDARYRLTPVVMLTTDGTDGTKSAGRAAGAKGWIVKPVAQQALLDAVTRLALD